MKGLIALLILVSGIASAAEIKVSEVQLSPFSRFMKGNFAVNPAMGRAWVEVEVADRAHGGNRHASYSRTGVKGLSFDASTSKIMLDHEGQLIECGYQTGRRIFKRIVQTNCHFETRMERRMYDDGYRNYKVDYLQLYLVTK